MPAYWLIKSEPFKYPWTQLVAEGRYDEQHRYRLYSESKWWHHPVVIPDDLHGTTQVNRLAVRMPLFHAEAPDLLEQYGNAFEKVWAHRTELGKG